jgi:hypothetical protein
VDETRGKISRMPLPLCFRTSFCFCRLQSFHHSLPCGV